MIPSSTALMLEELAAAGESPFSAPTMGNVAKVNYSHLDMIDYILAHPGASLKDLAARYGYSIGWICNVQASDAWKSAYAARRAQMVDPVLAATIAERFEGVTALSLQRLQEKLEAPQVSDNVVLRAVELGAKALGVGGNAPPAAPPQDHLAALANRLIELQSKVRGRTLDAEVRPLGDGGEMVPVLTQGS